MSTTRMMARIRRVFDWRRQIRSCLAGRAWPWTNKLFSYFVGLDSLFGIGNPLKPTNEYCAVFYAGATSIGNLA